MIRIISFIISFITIYSCGQNSGNKTAATSVNTASTDSFFNPIPKAEIKKYGQEILDYYDTNLANKGFNGSIIVAKNGQVLFEDYRGTYNFATGEPITEHTPFHLASISKTFTGMTVLKLWEEGRISLDDSLQKFFPKLPYHGVTVKRLLCNDFNNKGKQHKISIAVMIAFARWCIYCGLMLYHKIYYIPVGGFVFFVPARIHEIKIVGQTAAVVQQHFYCNAVVWQFWEKFLQRII